ncbi:unnamed protein product [Litomosoides sigmodontis]|uniref:STAS domain-containing protein n=1 Tax=Litomosoides sigmodontis TaxID=42156 RepID=A0A3P7K2S5_LITSI|nr:unnamed protein product [Litomosoides sigmodontis]
MNVENLRSSTQQYLILDCSGISYIDCMGSNVLKEVVIELKSQEIIVHFCACNTSVRDILEVAGIFKTIPKHFFFPTVDDAIAVISHLGATNRTEIAAPQVNHESTIKQLRIDSDVMDMRDLPKNHLPNILTNLTNANR